ncbi:MAG: hypothetical protein ACXAB4_00060 [Candidatus Hodarchaeales archaeon]|jgi:hypothetical protein
MRTPLNKPREDDYEPQILEEVLDFWKSIPNSHLQHLASKGEIEKAAKLWENRAKTFFHQFSSLPSDSNFQVVWSETYWKYYRSVLVMDKSGMIFLYPHNCFKNQGITKTFFDQLSKRWKTETEKSLAIFFDLIFSLEREVLADLSPDELACLKSAPRCVDDPATQTTGWVMPQFFAKETGISPNRLTKALYRLWGYGLLRARTYVNFARIGLKPHLFISQRNLEDLELDYCFLQVESVESKIKFSALAVPPTAIKMDWLDNVKTEGTVEPVATFWSGWNLSQLSLTGWGEFPSFHTKPDKTSFGQVQLDFQTTSIRLRPSDPLYLERIQPISPRELRAEFGVSSQQRLRDLGGQGVIQPSPAFRSIQCGASIFIYCRGASNALENIAKLVYHFPWFRTLQGANWILLALNLPPSWVYSSLVDLKEHISDLSIENLTIDVHQGRIERHLHFSKLWDKELKEWIA